MSINIRPGRIVPQDHIEWLISRYGYRRILLATLSFPVRRARMGLVRRKPPKLAKPPESAYLRRDIGLPPKPSSRHYLDFL
ncbi:hypothetical protein [Paracoccus albus]|uniref:hypothetical protein n=1 Tax=Paracoccus albus TaxID=3017784 RepID=UPI0022F0D082|nr:hypothetical protein [Paracoccus albus]WBU61123.1 hypothetical protein PAF20_04205 [Paracoccus albus]